MRKGEDKYIDIPQTLTCVFDGEIQFSKLHQPECFFYTVDTPLAVENDSLKRVKTGLLLVTQCN